jgi:hypothetical protein
MVGSVKMLRALGAKEVASGGKRKRVQDAKGDSVSNAEVH